MILEDANDEKTWTINSTIGFILFMSMTQVCAQQESSACTDDLAALAELLNRLGVRLRESKAELTPDHPRYRCPKTASVGLGLC